MKKSFVKLATGLLTTGMLVVGGTTAMAQQTSITAEQAKAIALKDANVKEQDAVFITNHRDLENGKEVYDIEFYVGNKEYDYEISVADGTIVQKDTDIEHFAPSTRLNQTETAPTNANAKQAALKHANLKENQVQHLIEKVDYENGRKVIEVTFYSNGKEYSYEIDAQTNVIVEWDVEDETYDSDDRDDDRYENDRDDEYDDDMDDDD